MSRRPVSDVEGKIGKSAYGQYGRNTFQQAIDKAKATGKPTTLSTGTPIDVGLQTGDAIGRVWTDVSGSLGVSGNKWTFTGTVTPGRGERFDFNKDPQRGQR